MEPRPYEGGSGAGGKMRRRPTRSAAAAATPYDRPPAAAAARRLAAAAAAAAASPDGAAAGNWLSRLVDPASRLIASGAARLFSTVFRNRLPALPPSPAPGENTRPSRDIPEATHVGSSPPVLDRGAEKGKSLASISDDKASSEVEHLLMQKTFTRVEFDRLTELLRSRTVESDLPTPQLNNEKREGNALAKADGVGGSRIHGIVSNHSDSVHARVSAPTGATAPPAELAKQFMSSRSSRGSPSTISLRSRAFLEDETGPSGVVYATRRSGAPLVPKSIMHVTENPELSENGYSTPRLRGRSAIYRMSRSPFFKGPSYSSVMDMTPFSSSQAHTSSLRTGGRQVLKRRNADLENELGSIGPIRRIRQKSNMMSPFKDAYPSPQGNLLPGHSSTHGADVTEGSMSIQESPSLNKLLAGTSQLRRSLEAPEKLGDVETWNDGVPLVPPQSNQMAKQIFEQLNIIIPSPKEKQSEPKSNIGNESPSMLIEPLPLDHGPSNKDTCSLKFRDFESSGHLFGTSCSFRSGVSDPLPDKKGEQKEDNSSKLAISGVKFANQDHSIDDVKSAQSSMHVKSAVAENSNSAATAPRKPGFKMIVLEDSLEFDDEQEAHIPPKNAASKVELNAVDKVQSNITEQKVESKISEQKVEPKIFEQKVEPKILEQKVVNSGMTTERPPTSLFKDISSSSLVSSSEPEKKSTSHVHADNSIGFTFPLVPSPSTHSEPPPTPTIPASPTSLPAKENEQTTAPTFTFGLKYSGTSTLGTSTGAGVKADTRLSESVPKPSLLDSLTSDKSDEREKSVELSKPSENAASSAASTLAASPIFDFGGSTSPGLSNGFSHSSSTKFSSDAASDVTPPDKPFASASSTSVTTFSGASAPISSAAPVFPAFNFGSSMSTGSQMAHSDKSGVTNVETKPASTVSFCFGSAVAEGKSASPNSISSTSSNLMNASTSSTFGIFSSPLDTSSNAGASSSASATSATFSTMAGLQSTSAPAFAFSNLGNSIFGSSAAVQPTSLNSSVAGNTSQAFTGFGTTAGAVFESKSQQSESGISQLSSSSTSQFSSSFPSLTTGSGTSSSGFGGSLFGSGAAFPKPFSSGSGLSFPSPSSSSASSSQTMASTNVVSSTSLPSSSSIFSNTFGSSSSPASVFTFGQSTSSGSGFTFASQPSPPFSFPSSSASTNLSTPQPVFGMTNNSMGFSSGSPGNDQMNVEDSMADDTNQAAAPVFGAPTTFGQPGTSPAAPVFGASAVQPGGSSIFQFGGHQGSVPQNPSPFQAAGSLEFQGGSFSLGSSSAVDKSGRRMVKVRKQRKK